ncbi:hypothetical protein BDM02DRAFT_3127247 [Thelephora ganbajun]|uniref:Uncharacterized protein n=1 Tax=Thelephora ganbajun TaxID=370292 RepID=A0ACB6ZNU8_THEGA|nr:hypothetical protein BDM02DRAFT_3127247 [Thelephora ganbajun]
MPRETGGLDPPFLNPLFGHQSAGSEYLQSNRSPIQNTYITHHPGSRTLSQARSRSQAISGTPQVRFFAIASLPISGVETRADVEDRWPWRGKEKIKRQRSRLYYASVTPHSCNGSSDRSPRYYWLYHRRYERADPYQAVQENPPLKLRGSSSYSMAPQIARRSDKVAPGYGFRVLVKRFSKNPEGLEVPTRYRDKPRLLRTHEPDPPDDIPDLSRIKGRLLQAFKLQGLGPRPTLSCVHIRLLLWARPEAGWNCSLSTRRPLPNWVYTRAEILWDVGLQIPLHLRTSQGVQSSYLFGHHIRTPNTCIRVKPRIIGRMTRASCELGPALGWADTPRAILGSACPTGSYVALFPPIWLFIKFSAASVPLGDTDASREAIGADSGTERVSL